MKIIGLTGNIGSGKSTVAGIFSRLGVNIYHADAESRKFLNIPEVKLLLETTFKNILSPEGIIDRAKLASIVFSDATLLNHLNSILHPLVRKDFHEWISLNKGQKYIIQEAAIIFESGFRDEFDKIIHVSCPEEIAVGRVVKRDNITAEMVLKRASFQLKEKEKAALADFVILNDGSRLLVPQVLEVHRRILQSSS